MELENIIAGFRAWLEEREILDVEISENVGPNENITAITFPIVEDEGYLSYDIIATVEDGGILYLYVDYCDIPDVDELELYRFLNDINTASLLSATVDEGRLCFSYCIPTSYIDDSDRFAGAFFTVWDAMDELRDDIRDAFGLDEILDEDEDDELEYAEELPSEHKADEESDEDTEI